MIDNQYFNIKSDNFSAKAQNYINICMVNKFLFTFVFILELWQKKLREPGYCP